MKKLYTFIVASLLCMSTFAQSPEMMSYQAVVRDAADNLVASSPVGMQISILQGSTSGTASYVETHTPTSNQNGLVSIEIGNGTSVSGDFSTIDWANGPYFIKTETDPTGGTSYTITGISQLLSVPYALYAKNTAAWQTNNDTTYTLNTVGVGVNSPAANFHLQNGGFSDLLIESTGSVEDASVWLKNPSKTWRLHGDQNDDNKFKIGLWTDYSEIGGLVDLQYAMTIDTIGNVGIGVGSPSANFHLQNGGFSDLLIESTGSLEDASVWLKNPSKTWRLHGDQNDDNKFKIGLWTDYSEIGGLVDLQYAMTIDTLGNVGIGTATPQSKLHIDNGFLSFTGAGSTQGIVSNIAPFGTLKFYCGPYTGNASNGYFFRESTVLGDVTSYNDLVRIAPHSTDVVRVGIGIMGAQRNLHVKDVMRLEPRATVPSSAAEGDIYMDSTTHKLMVYDGTIWQACW